MRVVGPLIILAGCSTGGVDVWGGKSQIAEAGGYRFKVIYTQDRAEAYRLTTRLRPRARDVFAAASSAIEQASGCPVIASTLSGDVALVEADLLC